VVGYIGLQKIGEDQSDEESTVQSAHGELDTGLSGESIQIRDDSAENNSKELSLDGKSYTDFNQGRQIGSGGNADVYEASIDIDGITHTVALKTPRVAGDNTIDDTTISELLEEAEVWDKIDDHERIVTVHGWGSEPLPWIAMEYMGGGTLKSNKDMLSSKNIFAQLEGLCEGLHYAHRNGITHTDIKPENILFSTSDTDSIGKFSDWGLANVLLEHSTSVHGLTPDYSAPEQIQPEMYGGTDDRTDIYQLGVVAYELFTDQIPYGGSSHGEMVNAILNAEPPKPSEVNPDLPEALDSVLLKAIEKNKQDRYETALHLRDDLRRIYHQRYK
jgi:serine/threonine protein kinase